MVVSVLPLKKIMVTHFAKSFWNAPFKSEEISGISNDTFRKWEIKLANHLEKTITDSSTYIDENKLPLLFKELFKESIFLLYQAYRQMLLWKIVYYLKNDIDLLKEGELFAPNYFTVNGEFNHFAWAKCFVLDPTYNIADRFNLACFYWFEDESALLWSELKNSNSLPCNGDLFKIKAQLHPLITLRIFQLEDRLDILSEDLICEANFRHVVLRTAALKGFEYAAYHFWQKISETEKEIIIETCRIFELISVFIDYPYAKVSYFFYSLLSKQRKLEFLDWTVTYNEEEKWLTLLHCSYTKPIRSEIIKFIYQLPTKSHNYLLDFLALRIREFKLPLDIELFHILWNNLSTEKYDILQKGFIIECFLEAKTFSLLGYFLKKLSIEQKEKCLFTGEYGSGVKCLNILSKAGEFDLIPKYLYFFLVEFDPLIQKETLRKDASLFLQKFIETPDFKRWCNKIPKANLTEVKSQIDALQTSLILLNEICDKVNEKICVVPTED